MNRALIPFITAGYPDIDTTEKLIYALEEAGADMIKLGLPFSDPIAESPTLQKATLSALSAGMTTDKFFALIKKVRTKTNIPIIVMTYANAVYGYGTDDFMKKAKECDIASFIIPDIPFEEKEELQPYCDKYGIKLISSVASNSCERIAMIAKEAEGFVYCISSVDSADTTEKAAQDKAMAELRTMVEQVKAVKDIPCVSGFDNATPEQAGETAKTADGIIVGNVIAELIAEHGADSASYAADYIRKVKQAVTEAGV